MKLNKLNSKRTYADIITGANIDLSYKDGLFLYHALSKVSENMKKLQLEVLELTDNIEPNAMIRDTGLILESLHQMLMPIAMEIVIPTQGIDIYSYNSTEEEETNNKKEKVQFAETIATH